MPIRFRLATVLPFISFAVGLLQAQPSPATIPSSTEVRALLESPIAKDQAWGAWWAANGNMQEMAPQLEKNLSAHLSVKSGQDEIVLDTTMDALIQFGANSLPLELLQSIYTRRHDHAQVLILLTESTQPKTPINGFMLTVLDENAANVQGTEWLTAADYLLSHHVPGFVGALLRNLRITGYVVICQATSSCNFHDYYGSGYGGSDAWSAIPSGFPPWPSYRLVKSDPDAVVFLRGPTPFTTMAYRRMPAPALHYMSFPTTAERMTFIAAAAPQLRIPAFEGDSLVSLKIAWHSGAAYRAELESFKRNIVDRYSGLIQQLESVELLSPDEAAALATPNLEIAGNWGQRENRP